MISFNPFITIQAVIYSKVIFFRITGEILAWIWQEEVRYWYGYNWWSSYQEENHQKPYASLTVQPPTTLYQDKILSGHHESDTHLCKVQFLHLLFFNTRLKFTHFPDLHFFSTRGKTRNISFYPGESKATHVRATKEMKQNNTELFRRTVNLYSLKKLPSDQRSVTVISKRITNLIQSLNWPPNLNSKT